MDLHCLFGDPVSAVSAGAPVLTLELHNFVEFGMFCGPAGGVSV